MNQVLMETESTHYDYEKHFIVESEGLLKSFSELSNIKIDMKNSNKNGEFFAKIEAKFLGLKIVSSKVGSSFADLSEDIFNDLVEQINFCRQWTR